MVSPKYLGWASLPQFPEVAVCAQTCFSNYRNPLRTCCSPGPSSSPAAVRLSLSGLCPAPLPAAAPQIAAGPTAAGPPELPGPPSGCSPKKEIQSQGVPHLPIPGYGSQVTLHLLLLPSVLFPHPCLLLLFGLLPPDLPTGPQLPHKTLDALSLFPVNLHILSSHPS